MGYLHTLADFYDYAFFRSGDPRVRSWPLLGSPVPVFAFIVGYLLVIKVAAPWYMRGRRPYHLKTVITLYNVLQVVANIYVFRGMLIYGWIDNFDLGCYLPDYSNNPKALNMASMVWSELCLKIVDLIETVFFILRGKESQASFLHVYHHVFTIVMVYIGAKYVPGGYATFPMMVNNFVHVIMYTYYLLSLFGPSVQESLAKVKRYITILQMVQFVVVTVQYFNVMLQPDCKAPTFIHFLYLPFIVVMFYLFYEFYQNTYKNKKD